MCGINGIISLGAKYDEQALRNKVVLMNNSIKHRGPDDSGIYSSNNVCIGMTRLSIIDLQTGTQPLIDFVTGNVIVFNGEIYNYKKLQRMLIEKGYIFTTSSDTEVVLKMYQEFGVDAFNMLNGMFAISIFDRQNEVLLLARDRVGEKPLYYYKNEDMFVFASELKSISRMDDINLSVDKTGLSQYLQLTYIPAPLSIYKNVYKMMPGDYAIVNLKGEISVGEYWKLSRSPKEMIGSYEECKKLLRKTLYSSVEETLVSDVPVGTFLSGGIDSTIVTSIASEVSNERIDSFCIGFYEKEYDETERAKLVAKNCGVNLNVFKLDYNNAQSLLNDVINNIDEPFADSSYIPTYAVSKFASEKVKVVLTGDAGDELFAGYSKYMIGYYSNIYNQLPGFLRKRIIEPILSVIPDKGIYMRKVKKVVRNSKEDLFNQRKNMMTLGFKGDEICLLLKKGYHDITALAFIDEYYYQNKEIADEISRTLYTDFHVVLEGDMLAKVDRASMLSSLETRVPMLHKEMIELANRIPSEYKIDVNNQKKILKETFSDMIPTKLINAEKKGFGVPVGNWLRNELLSELRELTSYEFINSQGIFEYSYIQLLINEHLTFKKNRTFELWTIFIFQKWYKGEYKNV